MSYGLPLVGVVPVSQWHDMALQMAEALRLIAGGDLAVKDFPRGVLADAEVFMGSVCEEAFYRLLGKIPSNPPATINDYIFARNAFDDSNLPYINEVCGEKHRYSLAFVLIGHFVGSLRESREVTPKEKKIAMEVTGFFSALAKLGQ